jgi:hypothetical protein
MEQPTLNWIKILEKLWGFITYIVAALVVVWLFYFLKNAPESNNHKILKIQQEIRKILE